MSSLPWPQRVSSLPWPEAVYGSTDPPCHDPIAARHHRTLCRTAIDVSSHPPHRRWHWHRGVSTKHCDFALFDDCVGFDLGRITAPRLLCEIDEVPLAGHFRLYDEDERFLSDIANLDNGKDMAAKAAILLKPALGRLQLLLRSRDVTQHGALRRVHGSIPPNKQAVVLLG